MVFTLPLMFGPKPDQPMALDGGVEEPDTRGTWSQIGRDLVLDIEKDQPTNVVMVGSITVHSDPKLWRKKYDAAIEASIYQNSYGGAAG